MDLEIIQQYDQVIADQQDQYLEISKDYEMPMVPITARSELEQFTNIFNTERTTPQLTLFTNQGDLLNKDALPELLKVQDSD